MEDLETKTQLLSSILSKLQQSSLCRPGHVHIYADTLAAQGLLCGSTATTEDTMVKWSQAVLEWFRWQLDELRSVQALRLQSSSNLLQASIASCDVTRFLEQYHACAVRVLQSISKHGTADCLWSVLTSIFRRIEALVVLPGLRREASSLAAKLITALQPLLTSGSKDSEVAEPASNVSSEMLTALQAALSALPTAFRTHHKALELRINGLLATANLNTGIRREAAHCFAALPKVKGDAETWSSSMQTLLCSCHSKLDIAFLGMDDLNLATAGKAGLDPQAQPLTPPTTPAGSSTVSSLGAQQHRQSMHSMEAVHSALQNLAGLLQALERLLTLSYPVAVPLPSRGILMLLTRILSMNDSARQAGQVPPSMSAYLALVTALPALHSCAMQLLQSLLQAARGAFTPHLASCSHLLANLLRQIAATADLDASAAAAEVRLQVYAAASQLVAQGGLGVGSLLGAEAVKCSLKELYGTPGCKRSAEQGLPSAQPSKKRKKRSNSDLPPLQSDGLKGTAGAEAAANLPKHGSLPAQLGALHLLQNLLQAGSGSMSAQQRIQVDAIAVHMASTASLAVECAAHSCDASSARAGQADLQLAAMQTLLVSVLSPVAHRPTFLPRALSIFGQGLHSSSPSVANFSQRALLSLEGLIHPRAGATVLQSDRQHPYHQAGQNLEPISELGMPRLWSALIPESYIRRQPSCTGADTSQQLPGQSQAAASAAEQVLAAGQLYSQAVQKLETALRGSGKSAVEHGLGSRDEADATAAAESRPPPAWLPEQQAQAEAMMGNTVQQEASLRELSQPSEAIPMDTAGNQPDEPPANTVRQQDEGVNASNIVQNGADSKDMVVQGAADADVDDGFISLVSRTQMRLHNGKELQADTVGAIDVLADAESSDSEGSLPDIDSGASDDSDSGSD